MASRLLIATLMLAGISSPVGAQQATPRVQDLLPPSLQGNGAGTGEPGGEMLPVPSSVPVQVEPPTAVSDAPGPRRPSDAAYGAFQRGFFLTALDLALARAGEGDAAAQTLIAEIYAQGLGVAQNLPSASNWYALASRNGDELATFELAMMYQEGRGVPRNRERAAELFQQAAEQGSVAAKYNVGLLHIEGDFVEPDLVKAAALIKEAADAGLAEAQYDYGTMLLEGAGVRPDPEAGAAQIALAAEQGLVDAQVEYATLLYLGQGVPQDRGAAVQWYSRAAEAGNAVAQNRYAKLLAAGEGVPADLETAAMWRAIARRQGLSDPQLDTLLAAVPPEQLARAEERARFWPSEPPTAVAESSAAPPLAGAETPRP